MGLPVCFGLFRRYSGFTEITDFTGRLPCLGSYY